MKNVLIYGSQQFALYVRELVNDCGFNFAGFIDDYNQSGRNIIGPFSSVIEKYNKEDYGIVIAIGYNDLMARWKIVSKVLDEGYNLITLIHPSAYVHHTSTIGEGSIICARTIIDYNSHVGTGTFVWPGVIINHDSKVGDNCFLSPQVNICGFVEIGDSCFIGASSVIINNNSIENNSFVKAGSVFNRKKKDVGTK